MERRRERLPTDRTGFTQRFVLMFKRQDGTVEELKGYVQTGEYSDGRLGELFVKMGKPGHEEAMYDEWAKAASLALQYGAGVMELFSKHVNQRFEPSGAVLGVDDIRRCTSVIDLIARWVIRRYSGTLIPVAEELAP